MRTVYNQHGKFFPQSTCSINFRCPHCKKHVGYFIKEPTEAGAVEKVTCFECRQDSEYTVLNERYPYDARFVESDVCYIEIDQPQK